MAPINRLNALGKLVYKVTERAWDPLPDPPVSVATAQDVQSRTSQAVERLLTELRRDVVPKGEPLTFVLLLDSGYIHIHFHPKLWQAMIEPVDNRTRKVIHLYTEEKK